MKNILKNLGIIFIVLSFTNCKKDDIQINTKLTKEFVIRVNQTSGTPVNFIDGSLLRLENKDTKPYLGKMKTLKVNSINYKIIDFVGDASGTINDTLYLNNKIYHKNINLNVKNAKDNATVFKITESQKLEETRNLLLNQLGVFIRYTGDALCDNDNMVFKMLITIDISATAPAE